DLRPDELIGKLPLEPGMQIVDFGCGTGFLTLPLAQKISPNGRVLAIDMVPEYLETIRLKADNQKLSYSITTKCVDLTLPEATGLGQSSIGGVVMANILFQNSEADKKALLTEVKRILRPDGFLLIVEWHIEDLPLDDKLYPLSREDIIKFLTESGFTLTKELSLSSTTHWAFLFSKAE
ncbi:MAG TPA: class I SAM-dependent methyltransferase, partial [Candidatus Paceibacterota bacterium]|nr:class I SAM-dependent methyltransferase [Candidatus Paceibacterota bacterium]